MRIDPDELRDVVTVLRDALRNASELTTGLQEVIGSAGACWGTDEAGQQFAASYVGPATELQAMVGQLPPACAGLASAIDGLVNGTQNLDGANASQIRRAGS